MTVANMSAEMGAKTGLVDATGLQLPYNFTPIFPDDDAVYSLVVPVDVSTLQPQVAIPHAPDQIRPIQEVVGQRIDQAFIGSCTNARLEDLQLAARILQGKRIHPRVRLVNSSARLNSKKTGRPVRTANSAATSL